MGGLEEFGDAVLRFRHGRRQSVLGEMVQGRPRILPIHARIVSADARVRFGRRKRRREYKSLSRPRFRFIFFIYFRSVNYFIARRVYSAWDGGLKITAETFLGHGVAGDFVTAAERNAVKLG